MKNKKSLISYAVLSACFVLLVFLMTSVVAHASSDWEFPTNKGTHTYSVTHHCLSGDYDSTSCFTLNCCEDNTFYALVLNDAGRGEYGIRLYKYTLGGYSTPVLASSVPVYNLKGTFLGNGLNTQVYSEEHVTFNTTAFLSDLMVFDSVTSMQNYCLYGDKSGVEYEKKNKEDILPALDNATYDGTFSLADYYVSRSDDYITAFWTGFKMSDIFLAMELNSGDNPYSYVKVELGYSPTGGSATDSDIVWTDYKNFYRAYDKGFEIRYSDIAPAEGFYLSHIRVTPYAYRKEPLANSDSWIDLDVLPATADLLVGNRIVTEWDETGSQWGANVSERPTLDSDNGTDEETEEKSFISMVKEFIFNFWGNIVGLVVPSQDYLEFYVNRFNDYVDTHYGVVFQLIDMFDKFIADFKTAVNSEHDTIYFPGIPSPLCDGTYLVEPCNYDFDEIYVHFDGLQKTVYMATGILIVCATYNFCIGKFEEVIHL